MSESAQKKQKTCPSEKEECEWSAYAAKPKPEHALLQSKAGTYSAKVTCYYDPSKPEGDTNPGKAIYTSKFGFGGLFLEGKWTMYDDKQKVMLEGQELFGYDSGRGEFYMTWIDTFTDQLCYSRGKQEGDIITFRGVKDDPMSGKKDQHFRQTVNVKTFQMDMYKPKDDNDTECTLLSMKITKELIPGPTSISFFCVLVNNYDEAINWYKEKLGFYLLQDVSHGNFRWVVMQAPGDNEFRVNLSEPRNDEEKARVGKQASDLFFYLGSLDCHRDYATLSSRGVEFTQKPKELFYGIDAHLKDLYGNGIGLCQVKPH